MELLEGKTLYLSVYLVENGELYSVNKNYEFCQLSMSKRYYVTRPSPDSVEERGPINDSSFGTAEAAKVRPSAGHIRFWRFVGFEDINSLVRQLPSLSEGNQY